MAKVQKGGEKLPSFQHKVWRSILFFFKVKTNPVMHGMDCLDIKNNVNQAALSVSGERDGDFMKYEILYTQRNLDICKSYLNEGSFLIVEPDSGLELKG